MELKEGMYVRTKNGIKIGKIVKIHETVNHKFWYELKNGLRIYSYEEINEPSYNIIDLIEEHDILLLFDKEYGENYKAEVVLDDSNFKVVVNYEQDDLLNLEYELITEEHVKLLSIVTKEQFEQIQYRIGD